MRGSGGFFVDEEANLTDYSKYHADKGDKVVLVALTLSRKQAKNIIQKAIDYGGGREFFCAVAISDVLRDDYGTDRHDSGFPLNPHTLRINVEEIEKRKRENK